MAPTPIFLLLQASASDTAKCSMSETISTSGRNTKGTSGNTFTPFAHMKGHEVNGKSVPPGDTGTVAFAADVDKTYVTSSSAQDSSNYTALIAYNGKYINYSTA
jgi:hypothetical protein